MPPAPQLGSSVSLRFHDKTRDRFLEMVQEARNSRRWTQKIVTESMQQAQPTMVAPPKEVGRVYGGLAAVQRRKEQ